MDKICWGSKWINGYKVYFESTSIAIRHLQWATDNFGPRGKKWEWLSRDGQSRSVFVFINEEDAVAFKLGCDSE